MNQHLTLPCLLLRLRLWLGTEGGASWGTPTPLEAVRFEIPSDCQRCTHNYRSTPVPWEYYRGKGGGASGYAYSDISYRINIRC